MANQGNIHIFIIDGEPYQSEMDFFNLIHHKYLDIPKIVVVNKWNVITSSYTKKEQEIVRERISCKMSKFSQTKEILYVSAMFYHQENDSMVYREIPELINQIKEIIQNE